MHVRKWIIPLVLVSVLIFILSLRQLSDPDLGFHLKYGQWITNHHHVPFTDQSTYTVSHHAYIDLHWLFQVILFMVYTCTGYPGISLFICLLGLLLSLLLLIRNRIFFIPASITGIALLAGFLIIDPRISPRPEMFTFLFITGVLLILDLYAEHRRNYLYLIPVIMLLWCNMHALFVLGLIITAVYFISIWIHERKPDKSLLIWGIISFLICFINPYGIHGFAFPLELLTRFDPQNIYNQHIQEFMPFFSQPDFVIRDYLFLVLLGLTILLTAFTSRVRKIHEIILLSLFAFLGVGSVRNIPLFVLVAIPIVSREIFELNKRITFRRKEISFIILVLMLLLPITLIPRILTNSYYIANNSFNRTGLGINQAHQPVEAGKFIMDNHLDGPILNSIGFGGWLSWVLPQPVFIDGRLEVMQESLYREVTESWNGGLPSLIDKYKPRLIIYNYLKYYPWTRQLKEMNGWRLIYLDGNAVIFTSDTCRSRIPTVDLSRLPSGEMVTAGSSFSNWIKGFYQQTNYSAIDVQHKAMFKLQMDISGPGKQNVRDAMAFFNAANLKYTQGDIRGALAYYDTAVALYPGYAKAYNNRGILRASALKDFYGAISDFDRALEIDPAYGDAYLGRGTAYFFLNDMKLACRNWNDARSFGNVQATRLIGLHCTGK